MQFLFGVESFPYENVINVKIFNFSHPLQLAIADHTPVGRLSSGGITKLNVVPQMKRFKLSISFHGVRPTYY